MRLWQVIFTQDICMKEYSFILGHIAKTPFTMMKHIFLEIL